jgi:hypothetical protein
MVFDFLKQTGNENYIEQRTNPIGKDGIINSILIS